MIGVLKPESGNLIVGFQDPSQDPESPVCCSLIHDRPKVLVRQPVDKDDFDYDEDEDQGLIVDLRDKNEVYFHRRGICPCEGGYRADGRRRKPRSVTWPQRQKQIVRACRGDEHLWLRAKGETVGAEKHRKQDKFSRKP